MSSKIRGEYWIQDGAVDFADGDVGEQNHEMVALNAIASDHLDSMADYAEELDIDTRKLGRVDDDPSQAAYHLIKSISHTLDERGESPLKIADLIVKKIEIDMEVYKMLASGGDPRLNRIVGVSDPRLYVMKNYGWIAVRSNNVELHGFDQKKKKNLIDGIEEILDQEGLDDPDEEVEFNLYDHKNGRSSDLTLADLKGESTLRPQTMPNTTYNRILMAPADRSRPMGSMSPKSMDARTRNMLQTSEGKMGFKDWLMENCGPFMVRRTWPSLIASEMEPQARRSSRGTRRRRRR